MSTPTEPLPERPVLPPKPDRPDCCDSGCATCVLMDYADEMAAWRAQCAEIEAAFAAQQAARQ